MAAKVYNNVFSPEEIDLINEFYGSRTVATEDYYSKNKNLEYHIPEDFSYQLLNPKITRLLGEHEFATGAYKECVQPYGLHVDDYRAHDATGTITTFATSQRHNKALLIPLVQGQCFRTVTFRCYSTDHKIRPEWHGDKNFLDRNEYSHETRDFSRLPVDIEYIWSLGDVLIWQRDQLHMSANFARHGVTKKFLILFIA
jgi:hypothetical protein